MRIHYKTYEHIITPCGRNWAVVQVTELQERVTCLSCLRSMESLAKNRVPWVVATLIYDKYYGGQDPYALHEHYLGLGVRDVDEFRRARRDVGDFTMVDLWARVPQKLSVLDGERIDHARWRRREQDHQYNALVH